MSARIAILLPRFGRYGGAEGFGYRLARDLAGQGHRIDFICARAEAEPPPGVTLHNMGRFGLTRSGKMLWFALQAEKLRKAGAYDLSIGLGKSLEQDLLRVGGGPLRAFWRLSERAWQDGAHRTWKRIRRRSSPANLLALAIESRQYAGGARIAAVSHAVAGWIMEEHASIQPDDIHVIYNEPDEGRFFPDTPEQTATARRNLRRGIGLDEEVRCLGFAGANFRLKGLEPLIRTLPLLPDDIHLVVAGGRSPDAWRKLAAEHGVAGRVHFPGRIDDMPGFYRGLDVFALPSFYDACANAVLEAVACGVPTVSSASNGSSIVLPPGQVVRDPADMSALAKALEHALRQERPARLTWPAGTSRGMAPWLDLVGEMLDTVGKRGA